MNNIISLWYHNEMELPKDIVYDHILKSLDIEDKLRMTSVCKEWHDYIVNTDDYKRNSPLFSKSSSFEKKAGLTIPEENLDSLRLIKVFDDYWIRTEYVLGFPDIYYVYNAEENIFIEKVYPYPACTPYRIKDYTVFNYICDMSIWKEGKKIAQTSVDFELDMVRCEDKLLLSNDETLYEIDIETLAKKKYKLGGKALMVVNRENLLFISRYSDIVGFDLRANQKTFSISYRHHYEHGYYNVCNTRKIYKMKDSNVLSVLTSKAYTLDIRKPDSFIPRKYGTMFTEYWEPLDPDFFNSDRYYFSTSRPRRIDLDSNTGIPEDGIHKYPYCSGRSWPEIDWENNLFFSTTKNSGEQKCIDVDVYELVA